MHALMAASRGRRWAAEILPLGQHHLSEDGQVACRGEEAGVARHPAQRVRVLVVHHAVDVAETKHRVHLGGRDPLAQRRCRPEARVPHPQGPKQPLGQKAVQLHAAHRLDHETEGDEPQVAVDGRVAGRVLERQRGQSLPVRRPTRELPPEGLERSQAALVQQELTKRHLALARSAPPGQVASDRRVQIQLPFIDQDHHRGRRSHHLGQRSQIVKRVLVDGPRAGVPVQPPVAA